MSPAADHGFAALLEYVHRQRGIDFSAYKEASLRRRFARRMQALELQEFERYLDHLQATPGEMDALLATLFINVTTFFRDPSAWEALQRHALEPLLAVRAPKSPIRVWCAGVASGEEAYTVAMLLCEALGEAQYRERVKIFATDVDEDALTTARQTGYTERQVEDIPEQLRERYFERTDSRALFRSDLRRSIIFGRHNLLEDAPISRLDLLICRNTLMYFNKDAQGRMLARFHFALREDGYLFLGRAEMLLTRRQLFLPIDQQSRIFRKAHDLSFRDRMAIMQDVGEGDGGLHEYAHLRDFMFDASPVPQLLVNGEGKLLLANELARQRFGIEPFNIGHPFSDLEVSFRPLELRSVIEQVMHSGRAVSVEGVIAESDGAGQVVYDIVVAPVGVADAAPSGVTISMTDVTAAHDLRVELEQSKGELETAYEELQASNEELETTNEELHSTIEELETTNEELHSTNEELETMNEELQSTNEEVRTVNDQLEERSREVGRLNAYLRAIVDGVGVGVVVLDAELHVQMWNAHATDLWGLRETEVRGRAFLNLDIGLPVHQLREAMRRCLRSEAGSEVIVLHAHNRRGKPFQCRVTVSRLVNAGSQAGGLILLMEPWPGSEADVAAEGA